MLHLYLKQGWLVARDHFGLLVEGAGQRKRVASVMATETEAIKLALLLANQQGWRKIIIETDSQLLQKVVSEIGSEQYWEILSIITDIQQLIRDLQECKVEWIPHHANRVADFRAKFYLNSCNEGDECVKLSE